MKKSSDLKGTKPSKRIRTKHNTPSLNIKLLGIQTSQRTVYDPNFHPEDYIQHCREGTTRTEICAGWGIACSTVLSWSKKYPDFKRAFRLGKEAHAAFHIKRLRDHALKRDPGKWGNVRLPAYMWYMKNTMGWGEEGHDDFKGDNTFEYSLTDESTGDTFNSALEVIDTDEDE